MPTHGYWRLLTVVATVAAFAIGCGSQSAVDHGGSLVSEQGRIAFTRATSFTMPNFESDIYTINVDGSQEKRLTNSPGLDAFPGWSPDGQRIAFVSDRTGTWEIYVMDDDGSQQRPLTNTPEDESVPTWSPDGEKIAYTTDMIGDDPKIWVMNADGSGRRQLASGSWPSWSPDSKQIVYTVYSNAGVGRLLVMNADGSNQERVGGSFIERFTGRADAEEPAWSPDGERIAFVSNVGMDNAEIYVMKVDGSERTRLTDIPGGDHWPPTWSADGTRIAFTSEGTKEISEIFVMNSDGSGLTKLTDNPADDSFPAWRP